MNDDLMFMMVTVNLAGQTITEETEATPLDIFVSVFPKGPRGRIFPTGEWHFMV